MIRILLYLHQLPQNILGFLVVLFTRAIKTAAKYEYVAFRYKHFGVSLGDYIIFGGAGGSVDFCNVNVSNGVLSLKSPKALNNATGNILIFGNILNAFF